MGGIGEAGWGYQSAKRAVPSGRTKRTIGFQNCWRFLKAEAVCAIIIKTVAALANRSLHRKQRVREPVRIKKVEFLVQNLNGSQAMPGHRPFQRLPGEPAGRRLAVLKYLSEHSSEDWQMKVGGMESACGRS